MSAPQNTITDTELAALSTKAQQAFTIAADECRDAVTLFDLGVARGILVSLLREGSIEASTFDRMYKRVIALVPQAVIASIPAQFAAHYGVGIVVPALRSTRNVR